MSGLVPPEGREQLSLPLFPHEEKEHSTELERLIDELRQRFGEDVIRWGRSF